MQRSLTLAPDTTLIYVAHDPGDRDQAAWLRFSVPLDGTLERVLPDALGDLALEPRRSYLIALHQEDAAQVLPALEARAGRQLPGEPIYDPDGTLAGEWVTVPAR